jgi:uncharacterized protein (TIGR00255 family)
MSVRSMTGFARVRKTIPTGEVVCAIKSVNHRGLDLQFHMAAEFDAIEGGLRAAVKSAVARGHMQVRMSLVEQGEAAGQPSLNRPLLGAYMLAYREAAQACGVAGAPDLNSALRVPGMFVSGVEREPGPDVARAAVEAVNEALAALNEFREREGAVISSEIAGRCRTIQGLVDGIEKIRETAVPAFQKRLRDRLADLLNGAGIEPQRLAQEAALLVDRSDVAEELTRLRTHTAQLEEVVAKGGEVGKRLDFLLQEMNREANTILSKTGGLGELGLKITDLALAAKAEIEKIREQSLNLE